MPFSKLFIFLGFLLILFQGAYSTTCHLISSTDKKVCSGHGTCLGTDLCICSVGYYGSKCDGFLPANRPTVTMYGIGENGVHQLQDAETGILTMLQNATMNEDELLLFSRAGQQTGLYFTTSNKTYTWGYGPGTGLNIISNIQNPQEIEFLRGKYIESIDSYIHTVISTNENELYGWGQNSDCQIDSTCTNLNTPTQMSKGEIGSNKIIAIACGASITLFLDQEGTVYTQGRTYYSGVPGPDLSWKSPVRITTLTSDIIFQISAGDEAAHVISVDNVIYGWGKAGLVGAGEEDTVEVPTPVIMDNIDPTSRIMQVCNGMEHGLIRTDTGNVYGWGFTFQGSIGTGTTAVSIPSLVSGELGSAHISHIACAGYMSIAVDSAGNLYRWGRSASSGLPRVTTPVLVSLNIDSKSILSHSFVAIATTGQSHIMIDTYKIPDCFPNSWINGSVCAGNGACIAENVCECNPGYGGEQCQYYLCFGKLSIESDVCSGHGNCTYSNQCDCDSGRGGPECQYFICYDILSNQTDVCSGHGICEFSDTCNCSSFEGYYGSQCDNWDCGIFEYQDMNVCSGHGDCFSPNNCSCEIGYHGEECNIVQCFNSYSNESTVCSSRGSCSTPDTCICIPGYDGNECEHTICFGLYSNSTAVCSGNGLCTEPDSCTCDDGYYGEMCQFPKCFGILANDSKTCSGNGICSEPDKCICEDGYLGEDCSVVICASGMSNETSMCSSHGNCSVPYTCTCDAGYGATDCSQAICNNILANETTACNGNGNCISPNNCSCFEGYGGDYCNLYFCYGILSNESSVCSGNGSCISPNDCSCATGFDGEYCQYTICFGTLSNDESVCSSRGNCTSPNHCDCEYGYGNQLCQTPYCFNTLATDVTVCSSHGICLEPDTCSCSSNSVTGYFAGEDCSECDTFFTGATCLTPYCDNLTTCNGKGNCTEDYTCTCDNGYNGTRCSSCMNGEYPNCIICSEVTTCNSHGLCTSDHKCECYQSEEQGYYAGTNCSSCMDGWTGSNCNILYPDQFTFSNDGDILYGNFANPNFQRPSVVSCSSLFSFVSFSALGSDVSCNWKNSSSYFEIVLGADATVVPGDILYFLTEYGYISLAIVGPPNPSSPTAVLRSPNIIGSCMDLVLDSSESTSTSARDLLYTFTSNVSSLNFYLSPSSRISTRTISATELSSLSTRTIQFEVEVTNFLGASTSSTNVVEFVDSSLPIAYIFGSDSLVTSPFNPLSLLGYSLDSCTEETINKDEAAFSWEQIQGTTVSSIMYENENRKITFEEGLPEVGNYTFRFFVKKNIFPVPSYTEVYIEAKFRDLVARINGGDRIVSAALDVELDGSTSYDPDNAFDATEYSYEWSCYDYNLEDVCIFSLPSNPIVIIPSGTLQAGNSYSMTLTYSCLNRTSTASVTWTVQTTQLAYATLHPLDTYISSSKDLSLTAQVYVARSGSFDLAPNFDPNLIYTWFYTVGENSEKEITSEITLTPSNQYTIIIASEYLTPGETHSFRVNVDVLDLSTSASATVTTIVNAAPQDGVITISPATGYGRITKFTLSTSWFDIHTPLQYQFYYIHPNSGIQVFLSPLSSSSTLNQVLFPIFSYTKDTNISIGASVYDFLGAYSTITKEITILMSTGNREELLLEIEKNIDSLDPYLGLLDLTTLLQRIMDRAQLLLSNEDLFCSSSCSGNGYCKTNYYSYSYCVCESGTGQDCSSSLVIKSKAIYLKESTLRNVSNILTHSNYQIWTEDDVTLISGILSTLLTNKDEISIVMIQQVNQILQLVKAKTVDFTLTSITNFLQSTATVLEKSSEFDSCSLSLITPLTGNSTKTQIQLLEEYLSLLSQEVYSGANGKTIRSDNNVMSIYKKSFSALQDLLIFGQYSMGLYYHLSPSVKLPGIIMNGNIMSSIDAHFVSLPKSPFPCTSLSSEMDYQSHIVMLRFMYEGTKIQLKDLLENIELSIPGNFSTPTSSSYEYTFICTYYDEETESWNTNGCSLISLNETSAICSCSHTTYFSVFRKISKKPDTSSTNYSIIIIIMAATIIICAILICCCFIMIMLCTVCSCVFVALVRRNKKQKKLYALNDEDTLSDIVCTGKAKTDEYSNMDESETLFVKKKSTSSLRSKISLHPWDNEYRGLPYYMRVYKTAANLEEDGSITPDSVDYIQEKESYEENKPTTSYQEGKLSENSFPIAIQVKSKMKDFHGTDVADPKPILENDPKPHELVLEPEISISRIEAYDDNEEDLNINPHRPTLDSQDNIQSSPNQQQSGTQTFQQDNQSPNRNKQT